jgi:hypothetical protein
MKKETLKKIFEFLKENGNHNVPSLWKLLNNEPLTRGDLFFDGDLYLGGSSIKSLPEGLYVGGKLTLSDTEIESLPNDLIVEGELWLRRCKNLKSLPKGLKVYGDLYISMSSMEHYSDDEIREMIKPGYINGEIF